MIAVCTINNNSEIMLHYSCYRGIAYDYEEETSMVPISICVSCCILKTLATFIYT